METTGKEIQVQTSSNNLPAITTPETLAQIRLNEANFPRYRNIRQEVRLEWMAKQMIYLAQIARIRDFDGKTAILMATALDEMMLQHKDIAELTLPEISDAFKSGVFGLYGEFYGLSAPNLYGFLCGFLESSKKKEATDLVSKSKQEAYREKTRAETERRQRAIQEEIEAAKRAGTFVPTGKVWFNPKMVNDAMRESKEHREKVRQQAREILNNTSNE